jgi:hypothetical protein
LELAAIRTALYMPPIDVRELHCPDLAELTTQLRRAPTTLHIATHNESNSVALAYDNTGILINWDLFADTVFDMPTAPQLIALNICHSVPIGIRLASNGPPALSWPSKVSDEQARQTAAPLYRQLGTGSTIGQSHREICNALCPVRPDLDQPLLYPL